MYDVDVTPLRGSPRVDVIAHESMPTPAVEAPDFVARLRQFFAEMDDEVQRHQHDPIATAQALARIEALLADIRYVRDRLHTVTAAALQAMKVRRLTVESVVTVEGTSSVERSEWRHRDLLVKLLTQMFPKGLVNRNDGEVWEVDALADSFLAWCRPEWKLTGVRDCGVNPDDYCTIKTGDDGKPLKTPSVRIVDNVVRGQR